jgi:hypothetical protein
MLVRIVPATMGRAGTIDFDILLNGVQDQFEDRDFQPNSASLFVDPRTPMQALAGRKVVWKRPQDLATKPRLFIDDPNEDGDGVEANDIIQGSLGDCYFLSAVAILASVKGQKLVQKLFVKTDTFEQGLIAVRFFKEGYWWDVAIDTFIPCVDPQTPCFVRMADPNEFWMIFLEKAYAKIHGCYEALDGGFMNEALVDLTGGAPGRVQVSDLFQVCGRGGRISPDARDEALNLLSKRARGVLLQGASAAGDTETALGNGLYSGHAYALCNTKKTSQGDFLVQLRNPWGGHEWTGAWNDKDPRWTKALKAEVGQKNKEDGMFWMSIEDFATSFNEITFIDLVPSSFSILRAESEWTKATAGGCPNHPTWCNNPQLLMKVSRPTYIELSLNQPDTRMLSKQMGKAAFDQMYSGTGYDESIGFQVWKGDKRKTKAYRDGLIANVQHSRLRTVSTVIQECQPGTYVVVPSTFDPAQMKFRMRFWSDHPIELIPTAQDWQIYNAHDDQLDQHDVPLTSSISSENVEYENTVYDDSDVFDAKRDRSFVSKKSNDLPQYPGMLTDLIGALKKAVWKVGEIIPPHWVNGTDFIFSRAGIFVENEMVVIMRSDRQLRFAKITEVTKNGTYGLAVSRQGVGLLCKAGVPTEVCLSSFTFTCTVLLFIVFILVISHQVSPFALCATVYSQAAGEKRVPCGACGAD